MTAKEHPVRTFTAFAMERTEMLYLPAGLVAERLKREAREERVRTLQAFGPTQSWAEKLLIGPSKIERNGKRLTIEQLFTVKEHARHHVFYAQGEKPPPEEGHIVIVMKGIVELKAKGKILDTLKHGGVLGDEALMGKSYTHSAVCTSAGCRCMEITVSDYIHQFHGGKLLKSNEQEKVRRELTKKDGWRNAKANVLHQQGMDKMEVQQMIYGWELVDELEQEEHPAGKSRSHGISLKKVQATMDALKKSTVAGQDRAALQRVEWKFLQHRRPPRRVPPLEVGAQPPYEEDLSDEDSPNRFLLRRKAARQQQQPVIPSLSLADRVTANGSLQCGSAATERSVKTKPLLPQKEERKLVASFMTSRSSRMTSRKTTSTSAAKLSWQSGKNKASAEPDPPAWLTVEGAGAHGSLDAAT
eukprot:gnl/TRDRNA2_/TRDRNA2_89305_c0_seq1.p1 gnl/TRDRNA2_/TRDRNA2_89305_c0~~gnl/TRDRNA2_/TRDRNA2_89305_c0_seq1.p1  ORF type:complete len:425 (-),score=78.47 gnl/TRDRNA2_/TRDRNA2_89305_c0_seq1:66-1310(-)